ncbi:hypothetical protein WJX73_008820 [Symbiochloris irregularis]|uniref:Sfi1 spindle body domain-containing protein n=1 Tax=Symbiochloris irregularis TaxID=706552 RepID=A0AAW1NYK5_9CHLO
MKVPPLDLSRKRPLAEGDLIAASTDQASEISRSTGRHDFGRGDQVPLSQRARISRQNGAATARPAADSRAAMQRAYTAGQTRIRPVATKTSRLETGDVVAFFRQGQALMVQSVESTASDSKLYVLIESDQRDADQQGTPLLVHRRDNVFGFQAPEADHRFLKPTLRANQRLVFAIQNFAVNESWEVVGGDPDVAWEERAFTLCCPQLPGFKLEVTMRRLGRWDTPDGKCNTARSILRSAHHSAAHDQGMEDTISVVKTGYDDLMTLATLSKQRLMEEQETNARLRAAAADYRAEMEAEVAKMRSDIGGLLGMVHSRDHELAAADAANSKIRTVALNMQARYAVNGMARVCFAAWREFSRSMIHRKDLAARQQMRNEGRWIQAIFDGWRTMAEQSKERLEQASRSGVRIIMQRRGDCFRTWKQHAEATSALLVQAKRSSERKRLTAFLRSWRAFAAARREASAHADNLAELHNAATLGNALQAWSAAVQHSRFASAYAHDLAASANLRLLGGVFSRWRALLVSAADTSAAAQLMHARAQERHLKQMLHSWRAQVHAKAAARHVAEAMGQQHDRQALHVGFNAFLMLSERGHEIEVKVAGLASANRLCQVAGIFSAWKEVAASLAATQQLIAGVQRQAQRRTVLIAFRSWQDETSRTVYLDNKADKLKRRLDDRRRSAVMRAWRNSQQQQQSTVAAFKDRQDKHMLLQALQWWRVLSKVQLHNQQIQAFMERKRARTAMAAAFGALQAHAAMKLEARLAAEDQYARIQLRLQAATTTTAFAVWRDLTADLKIRRDHADSMALARSAKLAEATLSAWDAHLQDKKAEMQSFLAARRLLERSCVRRVLLAWKVHMQDRQDARSVLQDVIQQTCNTSAADALLAWKAMAGDAKRLTLAASRIRARRAAALMRRGVEAWKEMVDRREQAAAILKQVADSASLQASTSLNVPTTASVREARLSASFASWHGFAQESKRHASIVATLRARRQHRLAAEAMAAWKDLLALAKGATDEAERRHHMKRLGLLELGFSMWQEGIQADRALKHRIATNVFAKHTCFKVLQKIWWEDFTARFESTMDSLHSRAAATLQDPLPQHWRSGQTISAGHGAQPMPLDEAENLAPAMGPAPFATPAFMDARSTQTTPYTAAHSVMLMATPKTAGLSPQELTRGMTEGVFQKPTGMMIQVTSEVQEAEQSGPLSIKSSPSQEKSPDKAPQQAPAEKECIRDSDIPSDDEDGAAPGTPEGELRPLVGGPLHISDDPSEPADSPRGDSKRGGDGLAASFAQWARPFDLDVYKRMRTPSRASPESKTPSTSTPERSGPHLNASPSHLKPQGDSAKTPAPSSVGSCRGA